MIMYLLLLSRCPSFVQRLLQSKSLPFEMIDERPIKPDQKYLEQYIERISKVEKKEFLKKQEQPVLPCYAQKNQKKHQVKHKGADKRTKAEIYEEIKQKNRQKFGDKKIKQVKEDKVKKLDPKKMTVNYKPKDTRPVIDIQQSKDKKALSSKRTVVKDESKVEYQKLLQVFKRDIDNFEKQKQEFNKVATKLKFKDMISKEQGLVYARVKNQVERNLIIQKISGKGSQVGESNVITQHRSQAGGDKLKTVRECSVKKRKEGVSLAKTFSIGQIRSCMDETNERLKQLKGQILSKKLIQNEHRYDISQLHLLPQFSPQTIFDYLSPSALVYNTNQNYLKALQTFNSKLTKTSPSDQNMCSELQLNSSSAVKIKYVKDKRVMRYQGWTQVWIPGRQRLMTDGKGYKVVWLCNGDVLQEFGNSIQTYYSQQQNIYKIQYKKEVPIYYHHGLNQLWRVTQQGDKQIVYGNGRREVVQNQEDHFV